MSKKKTKQIKQSHMQQLYMCNVYNIVQFKCYIEQLAQLRLCDLADMFSFIYVCIYAFLFCFEEMHLCVCYANIFN